MSALTKVSRSAGASRLHGLSWEEAVLWLRAQPDRQTLVRHCYFDDPVETAAARFHGSEEWHATRALLAKHLPGKVLDLGAGRGMASLAFAREGCTVTAIEPDPGSIVGRKAIEVLCRSTGLDIRVLDGHGEELPCADEQFDVVYGRAVLHHARDLLRMCRESARVLRPGGVALWVREHVISRQTDLPAFFRAHPLHKLYGGENAYLLGDYCRAITAAGLRLQKALGPLDNPVNYWPLARAEVKELLVQSLGRRCGRSLAAFLLSLPFCSPLYARRLSKQMDDPGRHFAFVGVKP